MSSNEYCGQLTLTTEMAPDGIVLRLESGAFAGSVGWNSVARTWVARPERTVMGCDPTVEFYSLQAAKFFVLCCALEAAEDDARVAPSEVAR